MDLPNGRDPCVAAPVQLTSRRCLLVNRDGTLIRERNVATGVQQMLERMGRRFVGF